MILLDLASRVRIFMWSFISKEMLSIISVMEYECEDEDGSVIGYTHRGEEMIVVLMVGDFLERESVIKLYFPLICLTWKYHCENQFDHLSSW